MTKEEAKSFLINISYQLGNMGVEYLSEKDGEKMREAIKSLEAEPCEDECIEKYEAIRRIEVRRKITCESDPYNYEEWTKGYEEGIDDAIAMINSVPSVTPKPYKGESEVEADE